jgi:hypothetical protein
VYQKKGLLETLAIDEYFLAFLGRNLALDFGRLTRFIGANRSENSHQPHIPVIFQ